MNNLVNLRAGRLIAVLAIAAALVGCVGDGSASSTPSTSSTPVVSTAPPPVVTPLTGDPAPTISGVAATTAKVGVAYSFQPNAQDTGNASLTFAISNAPTWATFNATTGRLSGTPTAADVGTDQNIIVQVSDGTSSAALAAFSITVAAAGSSTGVANLAWVAPTQNTDGSALTDLSGYVIHYGTTSKTYTSSITVSNPGLTSYVVADLAPGTYYFSMTTKTTDGSQSSPSAEASVTIT